MSAVSFPPCSATMTFASQRSLVADVSPLSVLSSMEASTSPTPILSICCGLPEAILDWLQSGVVHPKRANTQNGRRLVSMRQIRRRKRRLDRKSCLASVCTQRRTWRSCTAKVSRFSVQRRPVLLGTRPRRAPSPWVIARAPLPHLAVVLKPSSNSRSLWESF